MRRSQWYELVDRPTRGADRQPKGGKITHVQDMADALTLAMGDASVAGQFYNLVDGTCTGRKRHRFAKELSGSNATIVDRKGAGPKNQFDTRKAVEFFDRHGNHTALRRGHAGVREYVHNLLAVLPAVAKS